MAASISVGTAPINWNNADVPGWRPLIPFEQVLAEMVQAGYAGTELGPGFPDDPQALRRGLKSHGLELVTAFAWTDFTRPAEHAREIEALLPLARLLADFGCRHIIVASRGTPERIAMAGRVPADGSAGLKPDQSQALADGLHKAAAACRPLGLRLAFHSHAGSWVETRDELDTLCRLTDPADLALCLDCGHLAYGGADPVDTFRTYAPRIEVVHLKDLDPAALARVRREPIGWLDALRLYVFTELGRGCVDAAGCVSVLNSTDYHGWAIVEQDTTPRSSLESATRSRNFLREPCGV